MKIGDAVKFIGFENCTDYSGPHTKKDIGIIVSWIISGVHGEKKFNVLWGCGKLGRGLYKETLEVISESR